MKLFVIFSSYFVLLNVACFAKDAQTVQQRLEGILQNYEENIGVTMNLRKMTYLKLLKKTRVSDGRIFLSRGLMALQMNDPMNTKIVFNKAENVIWYITNFKDQTQNVVKADLSDKKDLDGFFAFFFNRKQFMNAFRFVSSRSKGRARILDFQSVRGESDVEKISLKVEGQLILKTWVKRKSMSNEEEYEFSDIRFNQDIPPKLFQWGDKS